MTVIIKRGASRQEISAAWEKLSKGKKTKSIDWKKYLGTIDWKIDAIKLQKEWRNEWN